MQGTGKRAPVRSGQGLKRAQHAASRGVGSLTQEIELIVGHLIEGTLTVEVAADKISAMNT